MPQISSPAKACQFQFDSLGVLYPAQRDEKWRYFRLNRCYQRDLSTLSSTRVAVSVELQLVQGRWPRTATEGPWRAIDDDVGKLVDRKSVGLLIIRNSHNDLWTSA